MTLWLISPNAFLVTALANEGVVLEPAPSTAWKEENVVDERDFKKDGERENDTSPPFVFALDRDRVWYGEKTLKGQVELGVSNEILRGGKVSVEFGTRHRVLMEKTLESPTSRRLRFEFPLRGVEPGDYQVIAIFTNGSKRLEGVHPVTIRQDVPLDETKRVALTLNWPEGPAASTPLPFYVGVSFPGGMLLDPDNVRLVDGEGQEVICQTETLATWGPKGSIRWLGMYFVAEPGGNYFVETGKEIHRGKITQSTLKVTETNEAIIVETGTARFEIPKTGPLFGRAWIGDEQVLSGEKANLILIDQNGRRANELGDAPDETAKVELSGPVHAVIRREGFFRTATGETLGKYVVRLAFDAGMPFVRVQHSFINALDTNEIQFSDMSLRLPPAFRGPWDVSLDDCAERDENAFTIPIEPEKDQNACLAQLSFKHHGQDLNEFIIAVKKEGRWNDVRKGVECGEWGSVAGRKAGVAVAVRDFTETFPKEIEAGPDGLIAHLWSNRGGRNLDYRVSELIDYYGRNWFDESPHVRRSGETRKVESLQSDAVCVARTHDLTVTLFKIDDSGGVPVVAQMTDSPPLAIQDPVWLRRTNAMGPLHPYDPKRFPRAERFIKSFFDYFVVEQEKYWGDYGFQDYGVGPHLWGYGAYDFKQINTKMPFCGYRYVGSFMYRIPTTPWRLYARSGDRMYQRAGHAMNRFVADFGYSHMETPAKPMGVPLAGGFAESYPFYWASPPNLYDHGKDVDNLLYHWYLTGDHWAWDTASNFADYLKKRFEPHGLGSRNSYVYQPYLFMAELYEATWDETLLEKLKVCRNEIIDLQTTVGLRNFKHRGCWYKWRATLYGPFRDYQATGSTLARDALLKASGIWLNKAPNGQKMGYYDHMGAYCHAVWRLTGNVQQALHGRELFYRRLFWLSDKSGEALKTTPYTGHWSIQGLETLPFLMSLIDETEHLDSDLRCPVIPRLYPGSVKIGESSSLVGATPDIHVQKEQDEIAQLRIQYQKNFNIQVIRRSDPKHRPILGPLQFDTYRNYSPRILNQRSDKSDISSLGLGGGVTNVILPKEALSADYLFTGVDGVLSAQTSGLVVFVPETGIYLPKRSVQRKKWYFSSPAGKSGAFRISRPAVIEIDGRQQRLEPSVWHELTGGEKDKVVAFWIDIDSVIPFLPKKRSEGWFYIDKQIHPYALVQFKGDIPPFIAPDKANHFFVPKTDDDNGVVSSEMDE